MLHSPYVCYRLYAGWNGVLQYYFSATCRFELQSEVYYSTKTSNQINEMLFLKIYSNIPCNLKIFFMLQYQFNINFVYMNITYEPLEEKHQTLIIQVKRTFTGVKSKSFTVRKLKTKRCQVLCNCLASTNKTVKQTFVIKFRLSFYQLRFEFHYVVQALHSICLH